MVGNQSECFSLVVKCLRVEKCTPREIHRRLSDVYGEACFSQQMFTNKLDMSLLLRDWVEKQSMEWKHIDFPVKKSSRRSGQ